MPLLTPVSVLQGHEDDVEMASWSSAGSRIATASRDYRIRIFGPDGTHQRTIAGHDADVLSVEWLGEGRELVSSSDDGNSAAMGRRHGRGAGAVSARRRDRHGGGDEFRHHLRRQRSRRDPDAARRKRLRAAVPRCRHQAVGTAGAEPPTDERELRPHREGVVDRRRRRPEPGSEDRGAARGLAALSLVRRRGFHCVRHLRQHLCGIFAAQPGLERHTHPRHARR